MSTPAVDLDRRGAAWSPGPEDLAPATARAQRRAARTAANLALATGLLALLWALIVWQWNDPISSLYTRWEQHKLAQLLEQQQALAPSVVAPTAAHPGPDFAGIARAAAAFRRRAHQGDPFGWISIPRIGLRVIGVNGTDSDSLRKGPGRYLGSFMPGEGRLVYIAGHRTTYLAPFARIDELGSGDRVTIATPYATFVYSVSGHRVVAANDLSVLASRGSEELVLQACHPRFFATHRYLVFATLAAVDPGR
jgi:sortase A